MNGDGTPDVALAGGIGYVAIDGSKVINAAIPNASLPYDALPFIREASISREGYSHSVADGHLAVPEAPGLGITLDLEACAKYRVERSRGFVTFPNTIGAPEG